MSDKTGPYTLKKLHTATYGADAYTIDGPTDIMGVWKGSEGAVYAAGAASNTPPDPDAHLTGEDYLKAKQERCAGWMKGQSAEEIEREMRDEPTQEEAYHAVNEASNELMWGKEQEPSDSHRAYQKALDLQGMAMSALRALEPSKAILLPMGEHVAWIHEDSGAVLPAHSRTKYHEDRKFTIPLFANTKAVSLEAIKKEIYQWRARHFNNPKEQADDLDSRLNNLTK